MINYSQASSSKSLRIGIDCRLWNETGVGRYTRNLVKNLVQIDEENKYVLFCLKKYREEILKQVQDGKFKVVVSNIRWHSIDEQIKFPRIIQKEKLDLMHFTYFSIPVFLNTPFVITIHDLIINHFSTGEASTLPSPFYSLKKIGYKSVIAIAAKRAKKIITVSQATKEEIVAHLKIKPEKIVVTYEGVDAGIQNSELRIKNDQKFPKESYFLYVGNAYPHKNLNNLIKAFTKLIEEEKLKTKLVFVGKEDYFYKRLKNSIKNSLKESVIFLHNVNDKDLAYLYKNAKACIMPSLMEGFGLPVLEAMANKCLVLASDIYSHREICREAAVYFDPLNVNDIFEKMKLVCLNDLNNFSKIVEDGFTQSRKFSWEKMAEQTLKVYEEIYRK